MRLREIFARLIELTHALAMSRSGRRARGLSAELEELADEVQAVTDRVWASPVQGPIDFLARAIVSFTVSKKEPSRSGKLPRLCRPPHAVGRERVARRP